MTRRTIKKTLVILGMIAFAVLATLIAFYLIQSTFNYVCIRFGYEDVLNIAHQSSWTDELIGKANGYTNSLAVYADSNFLAGIIYSLNGNSLLTFAKLALGLAMFAYVIFVIWFDVNTINTFYVCIKDKVYKNRRKNYVYNSRR